MINILKVESEYYLYKFAS